MKLSTCIIVLLLITSGTLKAMNNEIYLASIKSNRYHREKCKYVRHIDKKNIILFNTPLDAVQAGYKPYKLCKPPVKKED